jgi:hypothetical protein
VDSTTRHYLVPTRMGLTKKLDKCHVYRCAPPATQQTELGRLPEPSSNITRCGLKNYVVSKSVGKLGPSYISVGI